VGVEEMLLFKAEIKSLSKNAAVYSLIVRLIEIGALFI
jgi:hypothetical protein